MNHTISAAQIDQFDEQGFIVVDDFLDSDDLSTWRRYVDEAVTARQDRKLANSDAPSGDSYYDKVFTQRLNLWMDHDGVRELMVDVPLGRMAAELAASMASASGTTRPCRRKPGAIRPHGIWTIPDGPFTRPTPFPCGSPSMM